MAPCTVPLPFVKDGECPRSGPRRAGAWHGAVGRSRGGESVVARDGSPKSCVFTFSHLLADPCPWQPDVVPRLDQALWADLFFWWCLLATICTGLTFLIYFPAGVAQLRAVPASSPSKDQSRQLLRMDIELDQSACPSDKKNIHKNEDMNV